jgi:hypothetical protein
MPDPMILLSKLRRPSILVRAAQLGLEDYNRDRSLRRLLPEERPGCSSGEAFSTLVEQEAQMDDARRLGEAAYSVSRHIELLVALIFEARLLKRSAA